MFLFESKFDKAIRSLKSAKPSERQVGLYLLTTLKDRRALPDFRHSLVDSDALCRNLAVQGLLSLGDTGSIPELRSALEVEGDALTRIWMRVALIAAGQRSAFFGLGDDIATVDEDIKTDWDDALGIAEYIGSADAIDDLCALLEHRNSTVRWIAVMALVQVGTTNSLVCLQRALLDVDAHVRAEAAAGLGVDPT